jgi:hypothetical protein
VGSPLAGLQLERVIGIGSQATAYAATGEHGEPLAIKVLHSPLAEHAAIREDWLQCQRPATLDLPPAFVSVVTAQRSPDGDVFVVMERLVGEPLEVRLARSSLGLAPLEALGTARQLLLTWSELHAQRRWHGALQLNDLYLERGGRLRVRSFGALTRDATRLSEDDFETGAARDRWSAGVLLFVLLSGRTAVRRRSLTDFRNVGAGELPSLRQLLPGLYEPLADFMDGWLGAEQRSRVVDAKGGIAALIRIERAYAEEQQNVLHAVEQRLPRGS